MNFSSALFKSRTCTGACGVMAIEGGGLDSDSETRVRVRVKVLGHNT